MSSKLTKSSSIHAGMIGADNVDLNTHLMSKLDINAQEMKEYILKNISPNFEKFDLKMIPLCCLSTDANLELFKKDEGELYSGVLRGLDGVILQEFNHQTLDIICSIICAKLGKMMLPVIPMMDEMVEIEMNEPIIEEIKPKIEVKINNNNELTITLYKSEKELEMSFKEEMKKALFNKKAPQKQEDDDQQDDQQMDNNEDVLSEVQPGEEDQNPAVNSQELPQDDMNSMDDEVNQAEEGEANRSQMPMGKDDQQTLPGSNKNGNTGGIQAQEMPQDGSQDPNQMMEQVDQMLPENLEYVKMSSHAGGKQFWYRDPVTGKIHEKDNAPEGHTDFDNSLVLQQLMQQIQELSSKIDQITGEEPNQEMNNKDGNLKQNHLPGDDKNQDGEIDGEEVHDIADQEVKQEVEGHNQEMHKDAKETNAKPGFPQKGDKKPSEEAQPPKEGQQAPEKKDQKEKFENIKKSLLFPPSQPMQLLEMPKPSKEGLACDIRCKMNEVKDLKDMAWLIEQEAPEAKEIFEKHYQKLLGEIKKCTDEYKALDVPTPDIQKAMTPANEAHGVTAVQSDMGPTEGNIGKVADSKGDSEEEANKKEKDKRKAEEKKNSGDVDGEPANKQGNAFDKLAKSKFDRMWKVFKIDMPTTLAKSEDFTKANEGLKKLQKCIMKQGKNEAEANKIVNRAVIAKYDLFSKGLNGFNNSQNYNVDSENHSLEEMQQLRKSDTNSRFGIKEYTPANEKLVIEKSTSINEQIKEVMNPTGPNWNGYKPFQENLQKSEPDAFQKSRKINQDSRWDMPAWKGSERDIKEMVLSKSNSINERIVQDEVKKSQNVSFQGKYKEFDEEKKKLEKGEKTDSEVMQEQVINKNWKE